MVDVTPNDPTPSAAVATATSVRPALTVLITGGGTGGHVYPGLAVARELRALVPDVQLVWVGTEERLEARLVPQAGIPIAFIRVSFLKGRGPLGQLKALFALPRALWQSRRLLRQHRPDVVVGVGGFASGPVALWAALTRRPTAILEQNARPGLTNRLLGRVVRRVFTSFEGSAAWFASDKVRCFGNPVRGELLAEVSVEVQRGDAVRVLVVGGSQGARSLNCDLPSVLMAVRQAGVELTIRHAAGAGRLDEVREAYEAAGATTELALIEYIDDMQRAYAWADVVVCRAGASTVAELTALGKAAIYVPFPAAADNHQETNARAVVEAGGGLLVLDRDLREAPPVELLAGLFADRARLTAMGEAARRLGKPEAARRIAEEILELVRA